MIMYDENYTPETNKDAYTKMELKYNNIDFKTEGTESEAVCHPSHYNSGKIEVIDFIEDQNLGFHLGNAIKYICRAGKKDKEKTKEDLEKAVWYIKRYVEKLS